MVSHRFDELFAQRPWVGASVQSLGSQTEAGPVLAWRDVYHAFGEPSRFGVAVQAVVGGRRDVKKLPVARVQLDRAFKISERLSEAALPAIDDRSLKIDAGIIRQGAAGKVELDSGLVVIAEPVIKVTGAREMNFARIRLQTRRLFDRSQRQIATGGSVILA